MHRPPLPQVFTAVPAGGNMVKPERSLWGNAQMLRALRRLTDSLGRGRVVAALAVPTLALMSLFNLHPAAVPYLVKAGDGVPPLDIQFGYGPAEVHSLLSTYGVEGRHRYAQFLAVDMVYALCYGPFLAGLLRLALRPPLASAASRWNDLCLLPLFAGAADCVENLCILGLLALYPTVPPALAYTASVATAVKWTLAAFAIVAILIALGVRLFVRGRPPNDPVSESPR
jgi:hypothetical protein